MLRRDGCQRYLCGHRYRKDSPTQSGEIPIYEPGLSDLVGRNSAAGRLHFATSLTEVLGQVEIVFCAVGTPSDEDGSADLSHVLSVA